MDMRKICSNCRERDNCKSPQKYKPSYPDYYVTIEGRKVYILKRRIEKYVTNPVADVPDWEQPSFL